MLYSRRKRSRAGLKSVFHAQTIVQSLDETNLRNMDYSLAVNTLTGYLLLQLEKPAEALEFFSMAEKLALHLSSCQAKGEVVQKEETLDIIEESKVIN